MKHSVEILTYLRRERVIELIDSISNLKKWRPGLKRYEPTSGQEGTPDAKTKLMYDINERKVEMIETIINRNVLGVFSGCYETKGVHNIVENQFYENETGKTRGESIPNFNSVV